VVHVGANGRGALGAADVGYVGNLERTIERRDLIVIDELGYVPLGQNGAENLSGFFSKCYERTSVILTTNLPFSQWPQVFGDERLTGAFLDRLAHRVHHAVEMKGAELSPCRRAQTERRKDRQNREDRTGNKAAGKRFNSARRGAILRAQVAQFCAPPLALLPAPVAR
jgi:DNA replication protein DnaC